MATPQAREAAGAAVARRRDRNAIRVCWLLIHGHTRPQIAAALELHPNTVATLARTAGCGRTTKEEK